MGLGSIGGIVDMATGILGGGVRAKGAVHGAETQARAGQAALETQRQATEQAIAGLGYQTAPQRGVGTLALYQIASMLGIDPRMAFGGSTALGPGPGGGGAGGVDLFGPGASGGFTGSNLYSSGPDFSSIDWGAKAIGDIHGIPGLGTNIGDLDRFHGDPLGIFKNYQFQPASVNASALFGGVPAPGAPGSEFGMLRRPFSMADFFANVDPAYGFRLEQGSRGVEHSGAARGMQLSGSTLKDLQRFAQGLASTEFASAFDRHRTQLNDLYTRLAALASGGAGAAERFGTTAGGYLTGFGTEAGNRLEGIGNVLGAGQTNAANAVAGIIEESGRDTERLMSGMGGG